MVAVRDTAGSAIAAAALALIQRHPEHVRHVTAHEPPLEQLLDDHEQLRRATEHMVQTYIALPERDIADVPGVAELDHLRPT